MVVVELLYSGRLERCMVRRLVPFTKNVVLPSMLVVRLVVQVRFVRCFRTRACTVSLHRSIAIDPELCFRSGIVGIPVFATVR